MNFYAFKNRFKYGYKKFFAILFALLGVACQITALVLTVVLDIESPDILGIISCVIVLIAYYYLLTGNIRGTTIAYRGFVIFVFYTLFDFGLFLGNHFLEACDHAAKLPVALCSFFQLIQLVFDIVQAVFDLLHLGHLGRAALHV